MADIVSNTRTVLRLVHEVYTEWRRWITWRSVALCGAVVLPPWIIYSWLIRPLTSPLRKVPGLPWNPLTGNMPRMMSGQSMVAPLGIIKELGKTIVRYHFYFGKPRLMIADSDAIKYILTTNSKNFIKPPGKLVILREIMGEGLVTSEGAKHSMHKKLMSPFFNQAAVSRMSKVFAEYALRLAEVWEGHIMAVRGTKPWAVLPIHADLTRLTLDIIGETAFGYKFRSLEEGTQEVSLAVQRILSGKDLRWQLAIPFYFYIPTTENRRIRKDISIMNDTIYNIIKHKRESLKLNVDMDSVAGDLLGMMMMASDEVTGEKMDNKMLRDQVMTVMVAGHETTAVGMSWCLLALAEHPEIQEKARQEALRVLPRGEGLSTDKLEQLTYISSVIKETLRLFPPLPLTLRQNLEDDFLGGYLVPKGTILLLCIGAMMRLPEYFKDPEEFKPERYETEEEQRLFTFLPFLIGPRMCLGYRFALQEMKVVITLLLRKFKFEKIPGTTYVRKSKLTMRPDPALQLRVSLVEH